MIWHYNVFKNYGVDFKCAQLLSSFTECVFSNDVMFSLVVQKTLYTTGFHYSKSNENPYLSKLIVTSLGLR